MKLMTKELETKFKEYPIYSQDGKEMESEVIVKYFNPCGAGTWLITEGEKLDDGDWLLFGYCHIFEWEWGYIRLSELEDVILPYGMRIERDIHTTNKYVREFIK